MKTSITQVSAVGIGEASASITASGLPVAVAAGVETAAFIDGGAVLAHDGIYHIRVEPDDADATVRGWVLGEADAAVATTLTEGKGRLIRNGEVIELIPRPGFRRLSFIRHTTSGTLASPTNIACRVYCWRVGTVQK